MTEFLKLSPPIISQIQAQVLGKRCFTGDARRKRLVRGVPCKFILLLAW
jgi:hypothetical protein